MNFQKHLIESTIVPICEVILLALPTSIIFILLLSYFNLTPGSLELLSLSSELEEKLKRLYLDTEHIVMSQFKERISLFIDQTSDFNTAAVTSSRIKEL